MHIPDGFLSPKTLAVAGAVAALGLAAALRQVRHLPRKQIPLLGMCAAFVFAAQMLNFPVGVGISGHLLGGVLVAALLGPGAAIVVVTSVLIVQCLLFADGGLLSLGANILNMAIVDSISGYYIYRAVARLIPGRQGQLTGIAFGAWAGAVIASAVCAGELSVSGRAPANVLFPAIVGVHVLIGIGEALITALAILAVIRTRPELIDSQKLAPADATEAERSQHQLRSFVVNGLLIACALALFVSPFASAWPDGLDHVAEKLGFAEQAATPMLKTPLAEYKIPGFKSVAVATSLAGFVGTLVVFLLSLLLARILIARTGLEEARKKVVLAPTTANDA